MTETSGQYISGNDIWRNGGSGVRVRSGVANTIRHNSIYRNDGLGIDLDTRGRNRNDDKDPDLGANGRQNHPVITSARYSGGETRITGRLNSIPDTRFIVDVYRSDTSRSDSGGKRRVGADRAKTGAGGLARFSVVVNGRWQGQWLRATATRLGSGSWYEWADTSELGPARRAP